MLNKHEWAFSEITIYKRNIMNFFFFCEAASVYILSRPISAAVDFAQLKPTWFDLHNNEMWYFAWGRANMLTSFTAMGCYKCVRVYIAWRFMHTFSIPVRISWYHSVPVCVYFFCACVFASIAWPWAGGICKDFPTRSSSSCFSMLCCLKPYYGSE